MNRLVSTLITASVFAIYSSAGNAQQDDIHAHQHDAAPPGQIEATDQAVDHLQHQASPAEPVDAADHVEDHSQHQASPSVPVDAANQTDDHSQHQAPAGTGQIPATAHDHGAPPGTTGHHMTEHSSTASPEPGALRDPHGYSGGYELATGPYVLDSGNRHRLADETTFAGLWMDRLEYVAREGRDFAELEGHAWLGDSYNRVLLRTEAEVADGAVDDAEIDLLMYQAVSPFWDLQVGFRHQIADDVHRHWAVIGFNGLAPYWFEVDASILISEHGQVFYDLEAEYEIRFTQRLVLQPRIDVHSFSKNDEELRRGSGLSKVKLGARLRYEFSRQFAPYLGVERVSRYGKTVDYLPEGEDRNQLWWVAGLKFWF